VLPSRPARCGECYARDALAASGGVPSFLVSRLGQRRKQSHCGSFPRPPRGWSGLSASSAGQPCAAGCTRTGSSVAVRRHFCARKRGFFAGFALYLTTGNPALHKAVRAFPGAGLCAPLALRTETGAPTVFASDNRPGNFSRSERAFGPPASARSLTQRA